MNLTFFCLEVIGFFFELKDRETFKDMFPPKLIFILDKVTFLHHMSNDYTESITMDDCVNLKFDTNLY